MSFAEYRQIVEMRKLEMKKKQIIWVRYVFVMFDTHSRISPGKLQISTYNTKDLVLLFFFSYIEGIVGSAA